MNRRSIIFYASILSLLILPNTTFGKFIFNLAGSLLILGISVPVLIAIIAWLAFREVKSKVITCSSCGSTFFSQIEEVCPICGSKDLQKGLKNKPNLKDSNIPASDITIDINTWYNSQQPIFDENDDQISGIN